MNQDPDAWHIYEVRTHHDHGEITISTSAPNAESAKRTVMAAERCPECSILSVKRTRHRKNPK